MGKRAIGEVVDWEDMQVGDEVRFVCYMHGHTHWGYIPREVYVVNEDVDGSVGPMIDNEVPNENYSNTFLFTYHKLANTTIEKDEEEQPVSEFFGKKYRVTPETSKLLQEAVFAAGGRWLNGCKSVLHYTYNYHFVDSSGIMSNGMGDDYFLDKQLPKGKLEIVQTVKLVEVIDSAKQSKLDKIAEMKKQLAALEAEVNAE